MIHPQDATPANPAHGVSDALQYALTALRYEDKNARFKSGISVDSIRNILTAAIGAGGQAVATGVFRDGRMIGFVGLGEEFKLPEDTDERRPLYTHPAPSGQAVAVKPLVWEDDHGVAGMGPYRLFKAETPLGRFVYGTDAEGSAYYHTASSGVMMVGDEAKAKQLAEAAWQKAALSEVGKYVDPSAALNPPAQPGWRDMESAPKDGTVINVVARYPDATSGFPRYAAYRTDYDAWVEYSRFEPQVVIPWAWRPRDEWPMEPASPLSGDGQ